MVIGDAAFVIGAFLTVVMILVWKKLRMIDRRLGEITNELNDVRTIETRLFMIAINEKFKGGTSKAEIPQYVGGIQRQR